MKAKDLLVLAVALTLMGGFISWMSMERFSEASGYARVAQRNLFDRRIKTYILTTSCERRCDHLTRWIPQGTFMLDADTAEVAPRCKTHSQWDYKTVPNIQVGRTPGPAPAKKYRSPENDKVRLMSSRTLTKSSARPSFKTGWFRSRPSTETSMPRRCGTVSREPTSCVCFWRTTLCPSTSPTSISSDWRPTRSRNTLVRSCCGIVPREVMDGGLDVLTEINASVELCTETMLGVWRTILIRPERLRISLWPVERPIVT